jgi:hypothetical protein
VGIVLFQALISMLVGFTPLHMPFTEALMTYSIFSVILYVLTIAPAAFQHSNKNNQK